MKRVPPLVGWLIGLAIGAAALMTVGVWVLFSIFYGLMHGSNSGAAITLIGLGSTAAVVAACVWLAWRVKVAISRDR